MNRRELLIGIGVASVAAALPVEAKPGLMAGLPEYIFQPVRFNIAVRSMAWNLKVGDWISGTGLGDCRVIAFAEDDELTGERLP